MTNMSSPYLVIGAAGTVGGRIVQQLAAHGEAVRAATRAPERYEAADSVAPVRFDYIAPETYAPALEGARAVFMMAPADTQAYGQLVPFLDAAADADVEHVVLMTAMGVDQAPPEVPLRRAEMHLQESPLTHTILRPNWFMQNVLTYWRGMIERNGVLRLPADGAATSFIDARDIADVAVAALTEAGHDSQGYTLTGPEVFTYHEAAAILADVWGVPIRYEPVSDEEALRVFTGAGLDEDYAGMLIGLFQNVKAGHAAPVTPTVEQVTGHAPRALRTFAEDHAEVAPRRERAAG